MKPQIRLLGIDDAAFDKFKDKSAIVIGTVFRGGDFMDGLVSCTVTVDGNDATENIANMINNCKFKVQIRAVLIDGIAVGGFNVINVAELNKLTGLSILIIMRNYPDIDKIKMTLKKLGMKEKIALLEIAGEIYSYNKIHYQVYGAEKSDAEEILKISCTHSDIPEPIRIAHIIGSGLTFGESRGRA